jgi:hypothetical protein
LELRTATWWIAGRTPRISLDKVPSAAFVEGLLHDCGKEKRDAAKRREHKDSAEMVADGKWLSPQDQSALTSAVASYFTADRLNPTSTILMDDAWRFQGHLVLHLLNDDVIAVPRSELLGSLVRGTTCKFDKDSMRWLFQVNPKIQTPPF